MSEALMLLLAKRSRRKVWAHQLCHDIAMSVVANGGTLADAMCQNAEVAKYLSADEIRMAFKPESYIGTATQQVDETAAACGARVAAAQKMFRKMSLVT